MATQNLARAVYRREEAFASSDAFLEAYSRGDAAACAAFYTLDATVLPGDRPVASGREEIEDLFARIFEQGVKKLTLIPGEVSFLTASASYKQTSISGDWRSACSQIRKSAGAL